jgi:hypothetical protein
MNMKKILLPIITLTFLTGISFAPSFTYAQAASSSSGGGAKGVADGASCAVSQIVSGVVKSAIDQVGKKIAQKTVTSKVGLPHVPTTHDDTQVGANSDLDTAAHTGSGFSLFGINLNLIPSWDAVAYCIGNALITWVADGVTQWINSGFDGNPAFVDDPGQYFSDLADQTASGFIAGIVKGATGANICQPFRLAVGLSALNAYNSSYNSQSRCTLQTISSNMDGFFSGDPRYFNLNTFFAATQNPANNYWDSTALAQNELRLQLYTQSNLARDMLLRNNGYKDVLNCQWQTVTETGPDGKPFTYSKQIPETCKIVVNGSDTQKAGQDSRNLANLRLVAATKFDQVVTALVNQLIKRALNELLTSSTGH